MLASCLLFCYACACIASDEQALNTFGKVLACITDVIVSIFQVSKSKHEAREEHQTHAMGEGAEKITPVYTTVCSIVPFCP